MEQVRNILDRLLSHARLLFVRYILFGASAIVLVFSAPLLETFQEPQPSLTKEPAAPKSTLRLGVKLKRGDGLLTVLTRHGVRSPSAHDLIAKIRPILNLRKLPAGSHVDLVLDPADRAVQGMEVALADKIVRARATTQGWMIEREQLPSTPVTRVVKGKISSSLYENGVAVGLSPEHILELADIFEYDIDFFADLKRGDEFSVFIEELHYATGRRAPRKILAAELEVDGQIHSAFYFSPRKGRGSYYDSEGKRLRRAFLRTPLRYTRISSPYSQSRSHPILRIVRPHRAIDYAAPAGTPVVAIGRGRIFFSGWRRGYGNLVEIAHPGGYSSRYGHFSRIARGIRRGAEVNAGDVIGFVGQTGHATGPHLHFEFLQGSRKINFLTLKIPRIEHLSGSDLAHFARERDRKIASLRDQDRPMAGASRAL
jgi:murein DD-endopeptidase MepM/ murein hydrolase activator NlpD